MKTSRLMAVVAVADLPGPVLKETSKYMHQVQAHTCHNCPASPANCLPAPQDQYDQLQREVEDRSRAAAKASEDSCAADAAVLKQRLQQAQAALAATESELVQARSAVTNADSAHMDAYHALQAETMMLRTRLGELLPIEEKYKAVLTENRELYNTVQELRGNIRVFCRCVLSPAVAQPHTSDAVAWQLLSAAA